MEPIVAKICLNENKLDGFLLIEKMNYFHINSVILQQYMKRIALLIITCPLLLLGQTDLEVVKVNDAKKFKKGIKERPAVISFQKDTIDKSVKEIKPGNVNVIIGDERINILDDYVREYPLTLNGFRIQLVFGERNTVNKAKAKFYGLFSKVPVYESWLSPNFRLRVGDFLTRMQAEAFKQEVQAYFPGAYIVNDRINIPKFVKEDIDTDF